MNNSGKKSETDWAISIMQERQEPVFYAELIKLIAEKLERPITDSVLSTIYSRLNLDSRLVYKGDGFWYFNENRLFRDR